MSKITVLKNYIQTKYGLKFKTRADLEAYQLKKLSSFLVKLKAKSPIYGEMLRGSSRADWQQLPVVNKAWMMEHFDQLNTIGIAKGEAFAVALKAENDRDFSPMIGDITVGLSSGTSGNRGMFLVSPEERFRWAGTIIAKLLPASILGKYQIAFFLRANSNLYTSVRSNRLQFAFYDLLDAFERHFERLNAQQPDLLIAPPSMLRFLAEAQEEGKLHIKPRKVVSVAEVLDPLDEQKIAAVFQQKVHQVYQATEGFLGVTCNEGVLHLNEDLLIFEREYVDEANRRFVPLLTDFNRITQPVVRYRLDDILTEAASPCKCGSVHTAIAQIEGRADDCLTFESANAEERVNIFPDYFRRAIITASSHITAYRVVQTSPTDLEVHLQVKEISFEDAQNRVEDHLKALFTQFTIAPPILHWTSIESETPHVTKRRRIVKAF
jgi:putative adenylate-forming enzyme